MWSRLTYLVNHANTHWILFIILPINKKIFLFAISKNIFQKWYKRVLKAYITWLYPAFRNRLLLMVKSGSEQLRLWSWIYLLETLPPRMCWQSEQWCTKHIISVHQHCLLLTLWVSCGCTGNDTTWHILLKGLHVKIV